MRALILAAGRGERLRPLTDTLPKPLVRVGERTLLERHLERLRGGGVDEVFINVSWLAETIVTAIGDGSRFGLAVRYSVEGPGALETLGGIRQVLPWLGEEPFWVVNGDVYSDFAFPSAFAQLPAGTRGRLLLAENPPHNVRGDFALRGDRVVRAEARPYTYTGIACFDPALFADQPPGKAALGPLLFRAADSGVLTGTVHRGRWDDVGTLERLAELRDWQAAQPDD